MIRRTLCCAIALIAAAPAPPSYKVDGKPVRISFPTLGRVTVTPLRSIDNLAAQCAVRIEGVKGKPQDVPTLGTIAGVPGKCWATLAIGRVSGKSDAPFRVAVIHAGNRRDDAAAGPAAPMPVVLMRAVGNGRWSVDVTLVNALREHGGVETIRDIREHVVLFGD